MSRNHYYHSPYGGQRHASRWPWLFGALILAAVVATAAVLVQGDLIAVPSVPSGIVPGDDDAAEGQAAGTNAQPSAAPPTDAQAQNQGQAPAATDGGGPAAVQGHGDGTGQFMNAMPGQAAGAAATAAPPPLTPVEVVEQYAARWSAGDYAGMYELLSTVAKAEHSRAAFVERYEGIAAKAGLTAVRVSVTGEPNLQGEVPIRVEMTSELVGEIGEMNRVELVQENDQYRVAWTPSLIFTTLGADGCLEFVAEPARRGSILDRDGDELAFDGPINQVGIQPGAIGNDEAGMLRELSRLIGMPENEIKAAYEGKDPSWFVPIKNLPDPVSNDTLNGLADLAGQGVSVQKTEGRVYPLGAKAAHITGYVSEVTQEQLEANPDLIAGQLVGQAGVEWGANDELTGEPGGRLIVVQCDTRGERATIAQREAVPAKDVVLTIDKDFQEKVDAAVTESLKQTLAAQPAGAQPSATRPEDARASAVVLDPRTGAVLAMVSRPSYDPNGFTLGFSEQDVQALNDEKLAPLRNRATEAAYPTGSIFKAITTAAAMAHLGYTGETIIHCPSTFVLPGANGQDVAFDDWTVDYGQPPQGDMSLHNALVNSCNTAFYQLGASLDEKDDQLLPDVAKAFGLGVITDIPYLYENAGTAPDPQWKLDTFGDYWARGDAVNMAIGQGFLEATPLQMAIAYAAIANGGDVLRPYIVTEMINPLDGARERVAERVVRSEIPLNDEQIRQLQAALRDQTSNAAMVGSARVFGDFQFPIAGKTGTAENQMDKDRPHSWFAGFGPYGEEATIATIVMVETAGEGVVHAAPATRKIYEEYVKTDLARAPS